MHFINSSSLAPDVSDWLANSRHPRILHIFEHACNLINERREVVSIVTPQIGNGPFNLVLEDEISFIDYLKLESLVSNSPIQLTLGNLKIRTADAKLWSPYPDWDVLRARKVDIGNQLAQLLITNYLNLGGFDPPLGEPSGLLKHLNLQIPQSLVSSLSFALVNADISSARKITSQLAGLGAGLTPSGDDILMGALYAAWIIHPPEVARVLAQAIADMAAPLTTSLSAAWLKSAGKGEAGILWHAFFDALISVGRTESPLGIGNTAPAVRGRCPTYLQKAVENILAVGETSGADALTGFTGVLMSWMEKVDSSHG